MKVSRSPRPKHSKTCSTRRRSAIRRRRKPTRTQRPCQIEAAFAAPAVVAPAFPALVARHSPRPHAGAAQAAVIF